MLTEFHTNFLLVGISTSFLKDHGFPWPQTGTKWLSLRTALPHTSVVLCQFPVPTAAPTIWFLLSSFNKAKQNKTTNKAEMSFLNISQFEKGKEFGKEKVFLGQFNPLVDSVY